MTGLSCLTLAAALLASPAAAGDTQVLTPPPAKADPEILSAVVLESGVDRQVPKPAWSEYLPVLVTAAVRSVWDRLRPLRSWFHFAPGVASVGATAFIGLVVLAALGIAGRLLFGRWRRALPPGDPMRMAAEPAPPSRADAAEWLRELDRRLEGGDIARALEALWWFLARSVSSDEAHPSWTSGELLARARRHELRPFAVQLDRFRYGPRRPAPSEVRDLSVRLRQALA